MTITKMFILIACVSERFPGVVGACVCCVVPVLVKLVGVMRFHGVHKVRDAKKKIFFFICFFLRGLLMFCSLAKIKGAIFLHF